MLGLFSGLADRLYIPALASGATSYIFFTLPFVLYVLARWRAHREPTPDPQLGLKLALGYFALAGAQLALAGGTLLLYAIVSKDDDRGSVARAAMAMIVPGVGIWFVNRVLLTRSNQDTFPGVRALLAGIHLLIVGMLGMVALAASFQALFAKGSTGEAGRFALSAATVYDIAWAVVGWRVLSERMGLGAESAPLVTRLGPDPTAVVGSTPTWVHEPVPAPAPIRTPAPDPGKPGLPSLGGGAFPPIKKE